jgi:copper chaperone
MTEKRETVLAVEGMTCASCVRHVGEALREVEGVEGVDVRLRDGKALVRHAGESSLEQMIEALREAGFDAAPAA